MYIGLSVPTNSWPPLDVVMNKVNVWKKAILCSLKDIAQVLGLRKRTVVGIASLSPNSTLSNLFNTVYSD